MKIGVISDIHGNRIALDAVLDDMPPVDELVCLGDVIGYGPQPAECLSRVRDECDTLITGNHELRLVDGYEVYKQNQLAYEGLAHADAQLTDEQQDFLASLPETTTIADGRVFCVHSHPNPDVRWTPQGYIRPGAFPRMNNYLAESHKALCMGHTHVQHSVSKFFDGAVVFNPGSVGQPRDGDPEAAYATLDVEAAEAKLHRVEYDIDAVADSVEEVGLPTGTSERLYKAE